MIDNETVGSLIIAQTLLRAVCLNCRQERDIDPASLPLTSEFAARDVGQRMRCTGCGCRKVTTAPDEIRAAAKKDADQTFHIYVDETSKSETYFGVGAIFCRKDAAEQIAQALSDAVVRHKERPDKEIHWTELKRHLLPLYTDVGRQLISFTQKPAPKMRYRALMVESKKIDRSLDPRADREDILAKFIFTIVYSFAKDFGRNLRYRVFIDAPDGVERDSISTLCALNNKCKSELGFDNRPFKSVQFVLSHKDRMIQACDLISGAIAYETNAHQNSSTASQHRLKLWSELLAQSKLKSFAVNTRPFPKQFQIRHFDFEKSAFTRFNVAPAAIR